MIQTILNHFKEADRVDKQASVNSINIVVRNSSVCQSYSIYSISSYRVFVGWFHNHVWNVKMSCIFKSFIYPILNNLWVHSWRNIGKLYLSLILKILMGSVSQVTILRILDFWNHFTSNRSNLCYVLFYFVNSWSQWRLRKTSNFWKSSNWSVWTNRLLIIFIRRKVFAIKRSLVVCF